MLATAAQATASEALLKLLGESCDELLSMVLHQAEAYDLFERPEGFHSTSEGDKLSDGELLALLDKKLEDG